MSIQIWKKATTLIIAARSSFNNNKYNYKILFLKRSSQSKFMPNAHVFPGGTIEEADSSTEWIQLFKEFGYNNKHFAIFNKEKQKDNQLINEIALRISAIRETFEESNILLCKPKCLGVNNNNNNNKWGTFMDGDEIKKWQDIIHNDATQFIEMCRKLQCCPDIWSLQKWSSWLTPTHLPKRFEAIFFLTTLDSIPPTQADDKEITQIEWYTPNDIIEMNRQLFVWLPNPQLYEIARLRNFNQIDKLNQLINGNEIINPINSDLWLPKIVSTNNGSITLLPGDYMYPENMNMYEKTSQGKLNENNENLRRLNDNPLLSLNRIEEYKINTIDNGGCKIIIRNLDNKLKKFIIPIID